MGMVQMAVLTHPHMLVVKKKDRADLEHPTDIATAMEETLKACGGQLQ